MLFIFDMGGVVTNTAKCEPEICERLGISMEQFKEFCGAGSEKNLLQMMSDGVLNAREFWAEFSAVSGIEVRCDWFHILFHPEFNLETVALISKLKQKGHRVVCGTNTIDSHYHNHLERGDYEIFDQTYCSHFMGVSKPAADFWKIILVAEKVRAEDCVFIDDRIENVEAARKLGMKAFVFKDCKKFEDELKNEKLI